MKLIGLKPENIAAILLLCLIPWLTTGCATTGSAGNAGVGAGIGAVLGAAVGALVDDDNRLQGAAIGAAAGALAGGLAGYAWGEAQKEKNHRTAEELARTAESRTGSILVEPRKEITRLTVTPAASESGKAFDITTHVNSYGPNVTPPAFTLELRKQNEIRVKPLLITTKGTGEVEVTKTIKLPPTAEAGEYEVIALLEGAPETEAKRTTFTVS